jgi:hypothetical protein
MAHSKKSKESVKAKKKKNEKWVWDVAAQVDREAGKAYVHLCCITWSQRVPTWLDNHRGLLKVTVEKPRGRSK